MSSIPPISRSFSVPGVIQRQPEQVPHSLCTEGEIPHDFCCIPPDLWKEITGDDITEEGMIKIQESAFPPMYDHPTLQTNDFIKMALDRNGSRDLQLKLETATKEEAVSIFNSLIPAFNELLFDQFGNYVLQILCDSCDQIQLNIMLPYFLNNLHNIIQQTTSCRVLQKFIQTASRDNVDAIFKALLPDLLKYCMSPNGNHIVQGFIENLPERSGEVIASLQGRIPELVIDNYGCRVVQKLFEKVPIEQLETITNEVLRCADELAINQYGNYIVQKIVESGPKSHITRLIERFRGKLYEFSIHKFASNVIEKCIRKASDEQRVEIFAEIIGVSGNYNEDRIYRMIQDQFGNYVIQRIIEYGSDDDTDIIYQVVFDNYDDLQFVNYSRHVIQKLLEKGFSF